MIQLTKREKFGWFAAGFAAVIIAFSIFAATRANADATDSCRFHVQVGPAGTFAMQMSPSGGITWGINLVPKSEEPGYWFVDIMEGAARVDRKNGVYAYAPHGSVPPSKVRPGVVFMIELQRHVSNATHKIYTGVASCKIPRKKR